MFLHPFLFVFKIMCKINIYDDNNNNNKKDGLFKNAAEQKGQRNIKEPVLVNGELLGHPLAVGWGWRWTNWKLCCVAMVNAA
jgi:hypothetical protein